MSVTLGAEQAGMDKGLIRRNGRYSTRRIIPLDLQEHYGRREIVRALGTADPKDARRLHGRMNVALDDEFADVRSRLAGPPSAPQEGQGTDPGAIAQRVLTGLRRRRDEAAQNGTLPAFKAELGGLLKLEQAVLDGEFEPSTSMAAHEGIRNGLRAMLTGEGALIVPAAQASNSRASLSLSAMLDLWIAHKERPPATVASMHRVIGRFERAVGVKKVGDVSRQDVAAFVEKMREPGYDAKDGHSIANVNAMLSLLSALFGYAVSRNSIESNPASNTQIEDTRRAREKRREFDPPALTAIFGGPVHKDGQRPKAGAGEAAYWLPLLALYTGARINELAQLHPDDVTEEGYSDPKGKTHKAWVIRIEENKARGQKVKTEGSERRIPVHADLIKLGFLAYAKGQRGKPLLFDALSMNNKDRRISGAWGQWFSDYLRNKVGVTDERMTFHSFRHNFKHHARQALIVGEVHNALTGHETGDAASAYGGLSYPLHPLVEAMKRYRVPGLVLPPPPAV